MKRIFTFLLCSVLASFNAFGQTTISSETFENALTLFSQTTGTGTYYTGNSGTGDRVASSPFAIQGTYGYGISNGSVTITSSNINTVGYTDIQMSFRLASFSIGSTNNGADASDIVTVEISPNGGTNYYSTVRVLGNTNAYWSYAGGTGNASTSYDGNTSSVDFTPAGGANRTTDGYSTVTVTGLTSTSNLRIRITLLNNATAERWIIDDFKVTGTVSSTPTLSASPNSLTAFGTTVVGQNSASQTFNLSGSNFTNASGNITVTAPNTDFQVSSDDNTFGATATIPFTGNALTSTSVYVRFTPQSEGAKSGNITFSDPGGVTTLPTVSVSGTGTAVCAEPSGQPTNLTLTPSYTSISGSFTAEGSADGYLVVRSTSATLSASPVDGTTYAAGAALGGGVVVSASAATSISAIGLTMNTQYYFFVFSYKNTSCANINYLTSSPLSGVASTLAITLVINEILADPNGDANGDGVTSATNDEFVEIVNIGNAAINMSNFTLSDATLVRHIFPNNTILQPNQSIVIFGGGTPTNIQGIVQTASTNSLALTNTTDDVILKNADGITLLSVTYGGEAGNNQSIARNPDFTGAFVEHTTILSNPIAYSPGRKNTDNSILPVELTHFSAKSENNQSILSWQTATEKDNAFFGIEHVTNGNDFREIAQVKGNGTTTQLTDYQYIHTTPSVGANYYRLRQVDFNGTTTHSPIRSVWVSGKGKISLFPTVSSHEITLRTDDTAVNQTYEIYNMLGERVLFGEMQGQKTILISELSRGVYILKIKGENLKFVKE